MLSVIFLAACDFHGPWEYYPEEREIYMGVYTYGYVLDKGETQICFSKVYGLEESSAESFAFYDNAHVTVSGSWNRSESDIAYDDTLVLSPIEKQPNCFTSDGYEGIAGESYTMNADFEWDSAGYKVKSTYKAIATIPIAIKVKGMNVPKLNGRYEWNELNRSGIAEDADWKDSDNVDFKVDFLEYPMDMQFMKVALDYDKTVRGVLTVLNYDIKGGEALNTTMNHMIKGMTEADETGYRGFTMHDPLEKQKSLGFKANRMMGGFNALDTLYLMNMMMPLGYFSVDFYSTDGAYVNYIEKVKESVSDSRIVPESNIENGMGVFSGMAKTTISIKVSGNGVDFYHVAWRNCSDTDGDNSDSWDSRGCRLYQDFACSGNAELFKNKEYNWNDGNMPASYERILEIYRDSVYNRNVKACYASNVKAAMMLDTTKWSQFLPDSIDAADKEYAYADGLKRYCVASNFKNNSIADCSTLKNECLESPEKNNCKAYLWLWCADRNWSSEYEQCRSALVSRYYLQNLKSDILHREVNNICLHSTSNEKKLGEDDEINFGYSICKNWCKIQNGSAECL